MSLKTKVDYDYGEANRRDGPQAQTGMYGDGHGLYLQVSGAEHARSWVYRLKLHDKARTMARLRCGRLARVLASSRATEEEQRLASRAVELPRSKRDEPTKASTQLRIASPQLAGKRKRGRNAAWLPNEQVLARSPCEMGLQHRPACLAARLRRRACRPDCRRQHCPELLPRTDQVDFRGRVFYRHLCVGRDGLGARAPAMGCLLPDLLSKERAE